MRAGDLPPRGLLPSGRGPTLSEKLETVGSVARAHAETADAAGPVAAKHEGVESGLELVTDGGPQVPLFAARHEQKELGSSDVDQVLRIELFAPVRSPVLGESGRRRENAPKRLVALGRVIAVSELEAGHRPPLVSLEIGANLPGPVADLEAVRGDPLQLQHVGLRSRRSFRPSRTTLRTIPVAGFR